jgi:orotate phosphoribosyltransferase
MNHSALIAKILLQEKAVFLRPEDPFTWTSGIKSPVYCDNRLLISTIKARKIIVQSFCEELRSLKVDSITGTATAGIPWAAWVSMELELPLLYVRNSQKDHGRQNVIEGLVLAGSRTVLIEDLISTGKSSVAAGQKLQAAGIQVEKIQSIFSYGFPQAHEAFSKADLPVSSLTDFETLAQIAFEEKVLDSQALKEVLDWRKSVKFP